MRWIVYQVVQRNVAEVFLRDDSTERDFMAHCSHRQDEVSVDDDVYKMNNFFCDTEAQAVQLAGVLARRDPRVEVYIAQTKSIVCSARPTLITKAVTEKGVLPA